jgi:hypothetical protein
MSLKLPSFSIFDDFFQTPPKVEDPDSTLLYVKLPEQNTLFKYKHTLTISYLNKTRFKCIKDTGSFIVIINSKLENGPNAIYCISRSNKILPGIIKPLVQSSGVFEDTFELKWNPIEDPILNIITNPSNHKDQTKLFFYVKIITSF